MLPEDLLKLIGLLAQATDRSPGTIGRMVGGCGDFTPRLQRGHDITTRRAARVVRSLSEHWPADLAWPPDIPRPEPKLAPPAPKRGKAA